MDLPDFGVVALVPGFFNLLLIGCILDPRLLNGRAASGSRSACMAGGFLAQDVRFLDRRSNFGRFLAVGNGQNPVDGMVATIVPFCCVRYR